jgi:hypoxia up-regulated 1
MKLLQLLPMLLPSSIVAKAILGVDLGSLYMKVALVQRNSPLEIVTNLHSKRKTEQMVLFDAGTRFYGADANSLIARKPHLTPQAMSIFLGRTAEHPTVQILAERHYPITPVYNETRSGVCLTVDGQQFTPEELVAMVLTHAKDITREYGVQGDVRDCVLTVPSFYTQHERRALLDAAALADLNVLALIDETTAAGLHYGIDRIEEEPQNVLFYNMGASALQVSVMQFYSYDRKESKYAKAKKVGAFQVLGKAWDASLGGEAFDARLVDHMADEFNAIWDKKRNDGEKKDVRKFARPMAKLRIQANKAKHVLSANNDVPIYIDALHDDVSYQFHLTRAEFEEMCHDLLQRSVDPITNALLAANMTLADIHGVELIGGGMRVPKVQEAIQHALGDKLDLGLHINSDESMALGAAFHGANVSTAFKVRHIGMTDINPFPVAVSLGELDAENKDDEDAWSKHATIFKANGKVGVKKTIAFTHDKDIECAVDYDVSEDIPQGTEASIEKYTVKGVVEFAKEMADKGLGAPKVSLQFELTTSGLVQLVKAEAAVEETYTVTEEIEVDDEDATEESDEKKDDEEKTEETKDEEAPKEGDATEEDTKKPEDGEKIEGEEPKEEAAKEEEKPKKKKTISVEKEKKKMHKRTLIVSSSHVGSVQPYTAEIMAESKAKLEALASVDKDRMMLEEIRNTYESYIYLIKNKLIDFEEEIAAISTEEQREALLTSATEAEDWMYDEGYDAGLVTYTEKYEALSAPAEKIFFRMNEVSARAVAIKDLNGKLEKVEALMKKWETTMPQVTEEERADVISKVEDVRKWIAEKSEAQAAADQTSDPVFTSDEVPLQTTEIQKAISKLSKKPKPVPKKEEKKNETEPEKKTEEESEEKTETESEEKTKTDEEATEEEVDAAAEDSESKESTEETAGDRI